MTAEQAAQNVPSEPTRSDYRFFTDIPTRWSDNDMFGHLNNVAYNRFFEAVVLAFFRTQTPLDLDKDAIIPFAAEVLCRFRKPLSFPETVEGGLCIEHLGKSSVRYGLGLFRQGDDAPSAYGHWVHVFVDRQQQRPAAIPEGARRVFETYRR